MVSRPSIGRFRLAWWGLGIALFALLGWVVLRFIGSVVLALFVYYSTRPIHSRIENRIDSPTVAAATSLLMLAFPAILLVTYTLTIGVRELSAVIADTDLVEHQDRLEPYVDLATLFEDPSLAVSTIDSSQAAWFVDSGLAYVGLIGSLTLHLLIVVILSFYLLRDGHRLARWVRARFGDERGVMDAFFDEFDRDLQIVFFGNILTAIATGVIGAVTYTLLNLIAPPELALPYAVLLGLLTGAASLIPVVGMKLVYVPVTTYLGGAIYVQDLSGVAWFPVVFALVSFLIVDSIPDFLLRPYVSGRNVHVGAVMLSYIVGPLLFGWYGLFLGPLLLILGIHFARLVLPELLHARTIQPYAVDPTYLTGTQPRLTADPETTDDDDGDDVVTDVADAQVSE